MNIHIYPSPFTNETRILKEIHSLLKLGLVDEVVVLSAWAESLKSTECIAPNAKVVRLKPFHVFSFSGAVRKVLDYAAFLFRATLFCLKNLKKVSVINCHSLNVSVVGLLIKLIKPEIRLIYDAHELETERSGLKGWSQQLSKRFERFFIKFVDYVIVVCEPIAQWYRLEYGLKNITVIRNMPSRANCLGQSHMLRDAHGVSGSDVLFIYQGVLSPERGVNELLEVFKLAPQDRHIVFMGYGPSVNAIVEAAKFFGNIHLQPAVPPDQIIEYTSGADVGIFFISGSLPLSYSYSLPNKFFEYLHADCPVLVSESLPYLTRLVLDNDLGWSVGAEVSLLAEKILSITKSDIDLKLSSARKFAAENTWEADEPNLVLAFGGVE